MRGTGDQGKKALPPPPHLPPPGRCTWEALRGSSARMLQQAVQQQQYSAESALRIHSGSRESELPAGVRTLTGLTTMPL